MNDLALHPSGRASGTADACLFGLSLCSGAGGLDLGLAIAIPGYRAVGYVERETYPAATLVARMEDAALDQAVVWDDVGTFDGRPWRGVVDILSAGFMRSA
jgi:DNA (cytosine-5)-methyltransferase 1